MFLLKQVSELTYLLVLRESSFLKNKFTKNINNNNNNINIAFYSDYGITLLT